MRFWPAAKLTCCDRNICGDCRGRTKAKGERLKDKGRFDRPSFSANWFSSGNSADFAHDLFQGYCALS